MNKSDFNNNITQILDSKRIENISLKNVNFIKNIIFDKHINKQLYKNFKENYEISYGDDLEWLYMKTEDLVYRINLLVNNCIIDKYGLVDENFLKEVVLLFIENRNVSFYDAVSFDDSDYEIISEFDFELKELLSTKRI